MRPANLAGAILTFLLSITVADAEDSLTVVSYNIRQDTAADVGGRDWQARKTALTGYLQAGNFSIIGLQEVRHNQLLDVCAALKSHTFIGVGRDDGKTQGEYSPIFFHSRVWKLDPDQHGTFWLSDTPDVVRSRTWGNRYPRICTWARFIGLEEPYSGRGIYVYNTHWDHQSQNSRLRSAKMISEKMAARPHPHEPVILMGDFNASTENEAIKVLLSSHIVLDHGMEQKRTGSQWNQMLVEGLRIDHIFISSHFHHAEVEVQANSGVNGLSASDHHPVILKTSLKSVELSPNQKNHPSF